MSGKGLRNRLLAFVLSGALVLQGCNLQPATEVQGSNEQETSVQGSNTGAAQATAEQTHEFASLSDANLQGYLEDVIYSQLIDHLDSEQYFINNVEATYVSKEYLEELSYNSQENVYFGYNLAELQEQFQGTRYVFTLGDDNQTTVQAVGPYDDSYDQVVRNVAIGTGVILVCVTVSAVTGGTAPAVSIIFAVSAKTGTVAGLSGGAISAASAGIVTAIETGGDMDEVAKSAALAGSEGFMWGAIGGAISGGVGEATALKGATLKGLTMDEAATIQRESKYPLDVIKQFKSVDEYEVYKNAGLKAQMVGDRTALVQDIDLGLVDENGLTNLERMQNGNAPLDANGDAFELHHVGQSNDSPLAILTWEEHRGKGVHGILHDLTNSSTVDHGASWAKTKSTFWKSYAALYA